MLGNLANQSLCANVFWSLFLVGNLRSEKRIILSDAVSIIYFRNGDKSALLMLDPVGTLLGSYNHGSYNSYNHGRFVQSW